MVKIYGTTVIPSDQITVRSGDTVAVSLAFERSAVLVGGMDTGNGTATEGDLVRVNTVSEADDLFGTSSELREACRLALLNGVTELYAVPLSETSVTDEGLGSTASGTIANVPFFASDTNDEESITFTDTTDGDLTVSLNYSSPPPTPTDSDTVNINPETGEYEADAAATGSYEVDYVYGDFTTALSTAAAQGTRYVIALSENTTVANDLLTEVNNNATNFVFQHGVVGALPDITPSSYTDSLDDQRLSVVSPSRGYVDDAETNGVRTAAAVGGLLASKELGDSTTFEPVAGLTGLRNEYTPAQAGDLVGEQVLPLVKNGTVKVVKDMTTSTDPKFERVYVVEIVDEATEISHLISENFIGELNTEQNRYRLRVNHRAAYREMRDDSPPLLDGFNVEVTENESNPDQVDIEIGLDVVNVIDNIIVDVLVGDVVLNGGAE